jgi:hypothetical protein
VCSLLCISLVLVERFLSTMISLLCGSISFCSMLRGFFCLVCFLPICFDTSKAIPCSETYFMSNNSWYPLSYSVSSYSFLQF